MENTIKNIVGNPRGISIVASKTGVGKTVFLVQLSVEMAQEGKKVLFIACDMYRHAIIKIIDKNISKLQNRFLEKNIRVTEHIVPSGFKDKIQEVINSGFNPDIIVFDASFVSGELVKEIEIFSTNENIPFWLPMHVNINGGINPEAYDFANAIVKLEKDSDDHLNVFVIKNGFDESSSVNSKKLFFDRNNCHMTETKLEMV